MAARVLEARRELEMLAGMSEYELKDIGLTRSDLGDATALAADESPTHFLAARIDERHAARPREDELRLGGAACHAAPRPGSPDAGASVAEEANRVWARRDETNAARQLRQPILDLLFDDLLFDDLAANLAALIGGRMDVVIPFPAVRSAAWASVSVA